MSFNDFKKAIKDYINGKRGITLSKRQQEKLVGEFEQYCELIINGKVKFFNADNIVNEFGWLENYAKNEPDNKTRFKLYNIEQTALNLIGRTYINEDFKTMLDRIKSKCGKTPETENTTVGRFLATHKQYEEKYEKLKAKGLSKEYYIRVESANKSVAEAYKTDISKINKAYNSAKKEVKNYNDRNTRNIAEVAKR